jgi:hypothetical protein
MDEMRQLIAMRNGALSSPPKRFRTPPESPSKDQDSMQNKHESLNKLVDIADSDLQSAVSTQEKLQTELQRFSLVWKSVRAVNSGMQLILMLTALASALKKSRKQGAICWERKDNARC